MKRTLVCTGRCILKGNQKGLAFIWVASSVILPNEYWYGVRNKYKNWYVGSMHTIEYNETDHTVQPNTLTYIGRWHDQTQIDQWAMGDHETSIIERRDTAFANDKKRVPLECLAPLRKAYNATDVTGKRVIKLLILEYLEKGA